MSTERDAPTADGPRYALEPVLLLDDVQRLKAFADPLRLRILRALYDGQQGRALSGRQLQDLLGEEGNRRLYYHLKLLEEAGIITKAFEKQRGNLLEAFFRPVAANLQIPPTLLSERDDDEPKDDEKKSKSKKKSKSAPKEKRRNDDALSAVKKLPPGPFWTSAPALAAAVKVAHGGELRCYDVVLYEKRARFVVESDEGLVYYDLSRAAVEGPKTFKGVASRSDSVLLDEATIPFAMAAVAAKKAAGSEAVFSVSLQRDGKGFGWQVAFGNGTIKRFDLKGNPR